MIQYGFFLCIFPALITLTSLQEYIQIEIDSETTCFLSQKDRESPIFCCDKNDHDISSKFNSTHSWFIENNRKCVATIENIKKLNIFCRNRYFYGSAGGYNGVITPSMYGNNQRSGEPLKSGDIFN
nr:uncharacterized protein LOC111423888 [Onthophagus taurus]